ncbi:MAG: hypothetical protein AABW81_00770, partial [Nanoarchaeota archaeon]
FSSGFTSTCNEASDLCTTGNLSIKHQCAMTACNAQCEIDGDCSYTECDDLDGCVGDDYYDYADVNNYCLNDCSCTEMSCSAIAIYLDDPRCDSGCQTNSDCNDGLYCNGVETCNTQTHECISGTAISCSANNINPINTCFNNPDNNPSTIDFFAGFTSTCNENTDLCTTGILNLTHRCDVSCGSEQLCNGVIAGTNNCTLECKFKPPYLCQRDGEYGLNFTDKHEFVCKEDNTYYQCNQNGSAYVHVNKCSYYCSADLACNGIAPGASLNRCDVFGEDYLEDYCDSSCSIKDDNCESSFTGCTSDESCDEIIPGTGICTEQCRGTGCQTNSDCDNNLFCDGEEICSDSECISGTAISCSANNINPINTCFNNPDSNPFTLDFSNGFASTCNEASDLCTTGVLNLTHTCNIQSCDAECEINADCPPTECDNLDGCVGRDYYNYTDVSNTCLGDCSCTDNSCTAPVISYNDSECKDCLINNFKKISYSATDTGDIIYMNGYDNFTNENIDFFHGYILKRGERYLGYGSMHARGIEPTGESIQLNVRFTVVELVNSTCNTITWRNKATGTYWVYGVGTTKITYEYMDITYHLDTGLIDAVGVGTVANFDFKNMEDNNFHL